MFSRSIHPNVPMHSPSPHPRLAPAGLGAIIHKAYNGRLREKPALVQVQEPLRHRWEEAVGEAQAGEEGQPALVQVQEPLRHR